MPLGIEPTVDFVFKLLFGDPNNADLLIHLLNAVLNPTVPITQVELVSPFIEKEFEEDKFAILDIRARDQNGRQFKIEMQTTLPVNLPERLAYYTSCLYAEQLPGGGAYQDLVAAICICFLSRPLFPQHAARHLSFQLADIEQRVTLTDQVQVHTIELAKYNWDEAQLAGATDLEKWTFFLRRAAGLEADELNRLLPDAPYRKATGIVEMISHSPEQRRLHDARLKAQRDEATMQRYMQESMQKIQESEARGERIGSGKGAAIGVIQLLQQYLKEPVSEFDDLLALDLEELNALASQLRDRFEHQGRN